AHVVPTRFDAGGGGARLQIDRPALDAKRKEQAMPVERQMRARVEETTALQLGERKRIEHAAHDAAISATRKICDDCAANRARINAAPREIVDAFGLIFGATGF